MKKGFATRTQINPLQSTYVEKGEQKVLKYV